MKNCAIVVSGLLCLLAGTASAETFESQAAHSDAAAREMRRELAERRTSASSEYSVAVSTPPASQPDCMKVPVRGKICVGTLVRFVLNEAQGTVTRVDARAQTADVDWNIVGRGQAQDLPAFLLIPFTRPGAPAGR